MADDNDWGVPAKAPVATGTGRGRGMRPARPTVNPGNANDSWALPPGLKPAAPQGANSSWDTSVYESQTKPTSAPSTPPAADHSWDLPAAGTGRGVTASMSAAKIYDDWGVPPVSKLVPAGESFLNSCINNFHLTFYFIRY